MPDEAPTRRKKRVPAGRDTAAALPASLPCSVEDINNLVILMTLTIADCSADHEGGDRRPGHPEQPGGRCQTARNETAVMPSSMRWVANFYVRRHADGTARNRLRCRRRDRQTAPACLRRGVPVQHRLHPPRHRRQDRPGRTDSPPCEKPARCRPCLARGARKSRRKSIPNGVRTGAFLLATSGQAKPAEVRPWRRALFEYGPGDHDGVCSAVAVELAEGCRAP